MPTRCHLSESHEARLDSHTKLERFSTVCRVTAAPVLRTQTYHTSQPDQRPSTCKFCSGHKHTCVAVDGGGADHRGNEAKDGLSVAALAKEANGSNKTRHLAGLVGVIAGCIDREIVQRAISETLLEQDSDAYKIRPTRPLPHQAATASHGRHRGEGVRRFWKVRERQENVLEGAGRLRDSIWIEIAISVSISRNLRTTGRPSGGSADGV